MRIKIIRGVPCVGIVGAAALVLSLSSPAQASTAPAQDPEPRVSLLTQSFSVTTDLSTALDLLDEGSFPAAVGLRFENPQVVGEYYFASGKGSDEFLSDFKETYGTLPEIVGLVVATPFSSQSEKEARRSAQLPTIDTGSIDFEAPLVPDMKLEEIFGEPAPMQRVNYASTVKSGWEPQNVYAGTYRYNNSQYFFNTIEWGANSPENIPGSFGVEVQIDIYNGATGVRGSVLPWELCGPNFRDAFIAKNYNLKSWYAASPYGGLAAAYPYVDLNDLLDSCGKSSMAIGFASPQDMPYGYGPYGMEVWTEIEAQIGNTNSSGVGGTIQLVNSASCPFNGSIAFTDCMGIPNIPPPAPYSSERLTLRDSRGWVANPNRCWTSPTYGDSGLTDTGC